MIAGFIAAMVGGGAILFLFGFCVHRMAFGIVLYAILAITGAGTFIWAVTTRSDPDKSIAEYRAERPR